MPGEIFVPQLYLHIVLRLYVDDKLSDVIAWLRSGRDYKIVYISGNSYDYLKLSKEQMTISIDHLKQGKFKLVNRDEKFSLVEYLTDVNYAYNIVCHPRDIWCEEVYISQLLSEEDLSVSICPELEKEMDKANVSIKKVNTSVDIERMTIMGDFLRVFKDGEISDMIHINPVGYSYSPYLGYAIDALFHPFRLDEFLRVGRFVSNTEAFYNETEVFSLMNARRRDRYRPEMYIFSGDEKRLRLCRLSQDEFKRI